jgi:glycosyltransferase involved in cell wall biosynthesis
MSSIASERQLVGTVTLPAGRELETLASGEILAAAGAAEDLRRSARDGALTRSLLRVMDDGDILARMLALRALSTSPGSSAEQALVESLEDRELAEHAAWSLGERAPAPGAIPALARLVASGGFAAMPAQLALQRWSASSRERVATEIRRALARCSSQGGWSRLVETLALVNDPTEDPFLARVARSAESGESTALMAMPRALAEARPSQRGGERRPSGARSGLRVAQILLRGQVDAELEAAGSGEGGGVVTLLVQLARELGCAADVERSVIVARARELPDPDDEPLGPGATIVRLPFGPNERVPVSAMWEYRAQVEQAVLATVAAGPIDVAHLRYADAGTFAAARALRRAGVRIVFTLAPDPHALIAGEEQRGVLTRRSFAEAELAEHNLFRLRLVAALTAHAEHTVTLPRAGGRAELERLVGRPLPSSRTTSIPEGISVAPIERALETVSRTGASRPAVAAALHSAIARMGERRLGLPLILSAGRLHPVKGFPRLVEAWAGDPALVERFNLVIVGGDLDQPSPGEQAVIDEIDAVVARHPAVSSGLVLLGARSHDDIAHLLAIGRHGLPGAVAPGGLYACASAKEEFGVAILEALASGLAVVAPAGGGPGTYLEQDVTGILVEPGRVDTLRAGLHRAAPLAGDESRAARAMRLVRERFAIEPVASALAETYRRAAEAP